MTTISPIKKLSIHTDTMVRSVINQSPNAKADIANFLKFTNENNLHGPALVSFHTTFNKFKANSASFSREAKERTQSLPELIEKYIKNSPLLTKHSDEFLTKIEKLYPRSLGKRTSIASQGAVVADSVEPKSKFKKFFVWINQFLKSENL